MGRGVFRAELSRLRSFLPSSNSSAPRAQSVKCTSGDPDRDLDPSPRLTRVQSLVVTAPSSLRFHVTRGGRAWPCLLGTCLQLLPFSSCLRYLGARRLPKHLQTKCTSKNETCMLSHGYTRQDMHIGVMDQRAGRGNLHWRW